MIGNIVEGAGGFADLALAPELLHALSGLGYEEPTPIQQAAIPPLLEGVIWSVRLRPGRGRRQPSRFPYSSGSSGKAGGQSLSP